MVAQAKRLTAEQITAVIFDPVTESVSAKPFLVRLACAFMSYNGSSETLPCLIRHPSLKEAGQRLGALGLTTESVNLIIAGVETMMINEIPMLAAHKAMAAPGGMAILNDVHWSHDHYLGVAIRSPAIDLANEKDFVTGLRRMFCERLDQYINDHPTRFWVAPQNPRGFAHAYT